MPLTDRPRARVGATIFIAAAVLLGIGLLFAVIGLAVGSPMLGHTSSTTGTIVSLSAKTVVVEYEVDGRTYELTSTVRDSNMRVGGTVTVAYDPGNPAKADTQSARVFAAIFAGVGGLLFLVGVVLVVYAIWRQRALQAVIDQGNVVEATVTGVQQSVSSHVGSRLLTTILCQWTPEDLVPRTYRTVGRYLPRGYSLANVPVATLPVYLDAEHPKRNFVDDAIIRQAGPMPAPAAPPDASMAAAGVTETPAGNLVVKGASSITWVHRFGSS